MAKKQHHEEHVDETWLIPYADMLTLLLALFIVMFAVSQVDKEKFERISKQFNTIFSGGRGMMEAETNKITINPEILNSIGDTRDESESGSKTKEELLKQAIEAENESLAEIKKKLEEAIEKEGFQDKITIAINKDGLEITIQEKILFDSGDAVVHSDVTPILTLVAKLLTSVDNQVRIVGHTDNVPISTSKFRSNWELSSIRAINVMNYLLARSNLSPKRFVVQGNAEFKPKASNATEEGRRQNRRVEIVIVRKHPLGSSVENIENSSEVDTTNGSPTVLEEMIGTKPKVTPSG